MKYIVILRNSLVSDPFPSMDQALDFYMKNKSDATQILEVSREFRPKIREVIEL